MTDRLDDATIERAALYALGALSPEECEAVDIAMRTSAALRRTLREFVDVSGALMLHATSAAPPASLRGRLMDRLEHSPFHFTRAHDGAWTERANGVATKSLHDAPDACHLLKLDHGVIHRMAADGGEHWLVVSGEVQVGDTVLHRGDFHQAATAVTAHSTTPSSVVLVFPKIRSSRNGAYTVRATDGLWMPIAPGISGKSLGGELDDRTTFMLVRMAPNSVVDDHDHGGAEELYLLEGECTFAGRHLGPGDYHRASPGTHHGRTTTEHGCVMVYINRAA